MITCLTLKVLDQIRVNGFEVEVEDLDDVRFGCRCTVAEYGGAPRAHQLPDLRAVRALAEAYCTPAQVTALLRDAVEAATMRSTDGLAQAS